VHGDIRDLAGVQAGDDDSLFGWRSPWMLVGMPTTAQCAVGDLPGVRLDAKLVVCLANSGDVWQLGVDVRWLQWVRSSIT
jgi:hypothetical protein